MRKEGRVQESENLVNNLNIKNMSTDRATLVANYIQRQKDVAAIKERHQKMLNEKDEKRKMVDRTENYLKNIESIGQLIGEVIQVIEEDRILVK